jgi:hypothetical protein
MITKWLAEDLNPQINTGTEAVPIWTDILGLKEIGHSPSTTRADATDFNSSGREEHVVVRRGDAFTLSAHALEDVEAGVNQGDQDPGQTAVEALAQATGLASIGQFKFTTAGGRTATFKASAQHTGPQGGMNDLATWEVELTVTGGIVRAGPA